MQFKNYTSLIAALILSSFSLTAQVFFSEDFTDGVPAGWTSVDLTSSAGEEVTFIHSTNPDDVPALGNAATETFMAAGAATGYLYANSDRGLAAAPANLHTTELTTVAIDCSEQAAVFFQMETLIGVYEQDAEAAAILRVSTDNENWTNFTLFPNLTTSVRWSENPQTVSADISSVAAGQATVYVQWQWIGGWEYFWAIDDVILTSEDPRPANDMRVNEFFAVAPNAITPTSQVEPFGFIADIENVGSQEQVDLELRVTITNDGGTEVFTDAVSYDMIASDSLAENKFFDMEFTPAAEEAAYTGVYELIYESTEDDGNPENNSRPFNFVVNDTTFSKDLGVTRSVRPADDASFTYGNAFYVNSATDADGDQLYARYTTFSVPDGIAEDMAGISVNVFLYKWDGTLDANGRDITEDLYEFVGINNYTFTGSEGTDPINVLTNDGDAVALEANTYYIAAVQYFQENGVDFFLNASEEFDYQAASFYADSLERPRYFGILDVSNTGTLGTVGFGLDIVPTIRLSIGDNANIVSTEEVTLAEGSVAVYPNPAKEYANVDLKLEETTSGLVKVINIQGQIVQTYAIDGMQVGRIEMNTSELPNGQYTVRVETELGVSAQKIVVQH